jgi:hypothetical protein
MRPWTRLISAAFALLLIATPAAAQNYSFSVPSADVQLFVQPDASIRIEYDLTLANQPGAHVIDVVDIGVPHDDYSLNRVSASADGNPLHDVRPSQYVDPGFEVHLGPHAISPGQTGTVHVEFTMPDMVYQDTTDDAKASLRFTPTWFGEEFVQGTTRLRLAVHLPAGIEPEEAVYHDRPFSQKAVFGEDEHAAVVWEWPATRLIGPHMVGVSFPKRPMTRVVTMSAWGLLVKWFEERPGLRLGLGLLFFIGFGVLFFRFSAGTGVSVFVILSAALAFLFANSPSAQFIALPLLVVLLIWYEWHVRTRRPRYLPAIAQVEGGGIKRGLTAPEAAALLELPLGRVLGLAIFGLLKKGVLRQVQADPLVVEVAEPFRLPEEANADVKRRDRFYRRAAADHRTIIHNYEPAFLYMIDVNPGRPLAEMNFSVPLKQLLEHIAVRIKGFDLSDTQEYYRSIVQRAVTEARSVGDIEQREQVIDRNLEWLLIDDDWPAVFSTPGRSYRPMWTRTAGPIAAAGGAAPPAPASRGSTSFGDVAASFAGWTENTMGSLASTIQPEVLSVATPGQGVVNLSGFDRATGQFFKALAEASAKGGGGGGGGGCACAGCACACACAGGGR